MADFQAHLDELRAHDVSVLALSTDSREKARETVEQDRLGFPVAWGLDIPEDADRIGALYETKRNIIQPSEFLLGPDRRVLHATYSSGPIGRIAADDVVKLVAFLEARAQART